MVVVRVCIYMGIAEKLSITMFFPEEPGTNRISSFKQKELIQ